MTFNPGPGPTKGQAESAMGFELIERLLDEYRRSGRIITLERWLTLYGQRLSQFAADHPGAASLRDAAVVGRALDLARELVEQIVTTAGQTTRR